MLGISLDMYAPLSTNEAKDFTIKVTFKDYARLETLHRHTIPLNFFTDMNFVAHPIIP